MTTMPAIDQPSADKAVLEGIVRVFRERVHCTTEEELGKTCLAVAQDLTDAPFGFIGELNEHGRFDTIALSDPGWDACRMPDSDKLVAITNMEVRGLWSLVITQNESVIVDEPSEHPAAVGVPEGHPPLTAFLGVPLRRAGRVVGAIALGNKASGFTAADQEAIEGLSVAIAESLHSKRTEDRLARQAQEILEISTPVLRVGDEAILAPLIGVLDSARTQHFMGRLLNAVADTSASEVLLDITGVPTIDTSSAQHLIETVTACPPPNG